MPAASHTERTAETVGTWRLISEGCTKIEAPTIMPTTMAVAWRSQMGRWGVDNNPKAEKKIIGVMGATGAQGGGLVRAILDDAAGGFAARAITRDVNSEKARALARAGAEGGAADGGE